MANEKNRALVFNRRAAMIGGAKVLILGGLAGRLYSLQIFEAEQYRGMSEDNRVNLKLLEPTRGYLVDRYGAPLAVNVQSYRVDITPELAGDLEKTLDALSRIMDLGDDDRERVLKKARAQRRRGFLALTVRQDLTWQEVSRIEVNAPDLPGVYIEPGRTRFFPYGASAAHVIGHVGAVTETDMQEDNDPVLELPSMRIGKVGIERQYDVALRGKVGTTEFVVNALGREVRELRDRRRDPSPGHDIVLTLDIELQQFITNRLKEKKAAAVVVMEVNTGDVLALVSIPSFDPNAFSTGIGSDQWRKILANPYKPLTNKAIAGQYAPGSTFKMAVMLAALEAGIGSGFTAHCSGYIEYGGRRFHCWKRSGHGTVNMTAAIRESCDVYFYELSQKVGIKRFAAMARRLGLGELTGIDLAGEKPGTIPDPDWKRAVIGSPWRGGDTLVAGIGQGYVLATPLQLAVMTARIANGGKAVTPRLTRDIFERDNVSARPDGAFPSLGLKERSLQLVQTAMNQVVNHDKGTARGSRLVDSKWKMAGKTGTSQVRNISTAERRSGVLKNRDIDWLRRDHALFLAYAPVKSPRYAISVIIEHGGGGSVVAAPVARDIMQELERREIQLAAGEPRTQLALSEILRRNTPERQR